MRPSTLERRARPPPPPPPLPSRGLARAQDGAAGSKPNWLCGVTVSSLDSESSDPGSELREVSLFEGAQKERMLDRFDRHRMRPEITCPPRRPFAKGTQRGRPVAFICKSKLRRSARQETPRPCSG